MPKSQEKNNINDAEKVLKNMIRFVKLPCQVSWAEMANWAEKDNGLFLL